MKVKVVLQPGSFALNYRAITVIFTLPTYKWKFFPHEECSDVTQRVGNTGHEGYWSYYVDNEMQSVRNLTLV